MQNLFHPLVPSFVAERDASRGMEATARPSWFSERSPRFPRMRVADERKRSRRIGERIADLRSAVFIHRRPDHGNCDDAQPLIESAHFASAVRLEVRRTRLSNCADDQRMPVICPTGQVLGQSAPVPATAGYFAWGCFRYFGFGLAGALLKSKLDPAATALRSLSRLRGRVGVGVPDRKRERRGESPHPPRSMERVDLLRKRERCSGVRGAPVSPLHRKSPTPHAVFAAFNPSRASTSSRIKNFWILPVTVIGNSSTNST